MQLRKLAVMSLVAIATGAGVASAQTSAPAAPTTVKAVQPGLFEVAGPRVTEVAGAGIQSITATPGKGLRSIHVQSPWGASYFGWPKDVKPVAFTINVKGGTAQISAPGFTSANKDDYKTAIEKVVPHAIASTNQNKAWMQSIAPPR